MGWVELPARQRNIKGQAQRLIKRGSNVMLRRLGIWVALAASLAAVTGCGNSTGGRALSGGAIGAGGGAIVGGATGLGAGTGALIGAGAGALTGAATAHH
jgi:osmotically inducible lipoprotein OsmB